MSRTNILIVSAIIFMVLIWSLAFLPSSQEEFVESESPPVTIVEDEVSKRSSVPITNKEQGAKKVDEPKVVNAIEEPTKDYEIYKKKFKNKAFIKVISNVAFTGGDQIIGFLEKENSFEPSKVYKSVVKKSSLWPGGYVPYGFSEDFPDEMKDRVLRAVEYFNFETPVRFVEYDSEKDEDAVAFVFNEEVPCSSYVGRVGGLQQVFLNYDCKEQSILHELMHALGFVHEQQLPGRDEFLEVLWSNIEKDALHNFTEAPEVWTKNYQEFDGDFDYTSIMMYSDQAFALPGKKSMSSKTEVLIKPSTNGLSEIDIERLRILY